MSNVASNDPPGVSKDNTIAVYGVSLLVFSGGMDTLSIASSILSAVAGYPEYRFSIIIIDIILIHGATVDIIAAIPNAFSFC